MIMTMIVTMTMIMAKIITMIIIMIIENYSTSARWIWVGCNHLISNNREWNSCFTKKAHKISMNLPDYFVRTNRKATKYRWISPTILLEQTGKATKYRWIFPTILLEQTGKDKGLPLSHVTRLSKLSTRERTGWMKNQNIEAMNTFCKKGHRDSRILHSRTAKILADNQNKKNVEVQPSKLLWIVQFRIKNYRWI